MTSSTTMRRFKWLFLGLDLMLASAAALASPRVGSGHAYAILGDLPVMHRDRVKPLSRWPSKRSD